MNNQQQVESENEIHIREIAEFFKISIGNELEFLLEQIDDACLQEGDEQTYLLLFKDNENRYSIKFKVESERTLHEVQREKDIMLPGFIEFASQYPQHSLIKNIHYNPNNRRDPDGTTILAIKKKKGEKLYDAITLYVRRFR